MVKNNIFGFDIFVNHALIMHAVERFNHRSGDKLDLLFREAAFAVDMVT
jgi:hypothetical protein